MYRVISNKSALDFDQVDFMCWTGETIPSFNLFMPTITDLEGKPEPELQVLLKSGAWVTLRGLDALLCWAYKLEQSYYHDTGTADSLEEVYQDNLATIAAAAEREELERQGLCSGCTHTDHRGHNCLEQDCKCDYDDIPF